MKWLWIVCALVVPVEPVMAVPVSFPPASDTLVAALQRGGYVLVFRHAHTDRSKMDDQNWSLAERSTQRNLSERGAEEAKRIGRAIAALRIPVGDVLTSPMFRTRETAELGFSRADTTELLRSRGSTPEARALLTMAPAPGTNRVLVTHNAYIGRHLSDRGLGRIEEGDVVVVRPLGQDGFEVLGKITVGQWEQLLEGGRGLPDPAAAGAQTLKISPSSLVMPAPPWGALVEPHVAAHPTAAGHLVAGVMVADTAGAPSTRSHCVTLVSTDGGQTWASRRQPFANCADPWLAVTGSGEAVFAGLGMHPALGVPGQMGLLVARSPDGGRTWNDTIVGLGRGHDRETMMADPRSGAQRSVVIVSGHGIKLDDAPIRWSVFVARSVNAGRSFREPVTTLPSNLNLNAQEGVILHDGTILASFVDFQRNVGNFAREGGMLARRRIWMLRSRDDGRTFSPPLFVTEHCGRSSYDVAADASDGPHRGRVYLVCRSLEGSGILLHHSDDRGETWSAPKLLTPDTAGAFRTQPRLAVNREGVVGAVWLDAARDTSGRCYRVLAAASRDGGETFTGPEPVSPHACPDPARNGFALRRWRQGGDYFGWVAAADGRFHALWTDARRGPFELWTATVEVQ